MYSVIGGGGDYSMSRYGMRSVHSGRWIWSGRKNRIDVWKILRMIANECGSENRNVSASAKENAALPASSCSNSFTFGAFCKVVM